MNARLLASAGKLVYAGAVVAFVGYVYVTGALLPRRSLSQRMAAEGFKRLKKYDPLPKDE